MFCYTRFTIAILAATLLLLSYDRSEAQPGHDDAGHSLPPSTDSVPLYNDLGDHHVAITTDIASAQSYFDQGMRLYYAFNHAEAVRAFREAQRLDEECAMCWWGEAMAWGPNINLPMDEPSAIAAYAAVQGALARREHASKREQTLIDALAVRYVAQPPTDRAIFDQAYSDAMADVATYYPNNQEIAVLYAESLLNLRPWDYWAEDGSPNPGIADALASLESVIAVNEKHPGACHFFIHAVEKLYPERAIECAERLAKLMPGAGHLVHMPGHIYIRIGRYLDAVEANKHAIHADETYIQDQNPAMGMYTAGYYPHNYDFMAFATMMIGRSEDSIEAAETVSRLLPAELFGSPGMDFLQHWSIRPLLVRVRFARWDDLLATSAPPESQPHAMAMWHYARGRAFAARQEQKAAAGELAKLRLIASSSALDDIYMEFNPSGDLVAIAESVLAGWVDVAGGNFESAVDHLYEAVRLEDSLKYGEPPEWTMPTRQDLGDILLLAKRYEDAERAFHEDLLHFPKNGWSLHGIAKSLTAQGRVEEAAAANTELQLAWSNADVSVVDPSASRPKD